MGKFIILLICVFVVVVGAWLVLGPESDLANPSVSGNAYAEESSFGRHPSEKQEQDTAEVSKLETQEDLLRHAYDRTATQRVDAVLKLLEIKQEPSTLVPALAKLYSDRDQLVRIASGIVLNKIGPEGAVHLRELMESENLAENAAACAALKEMGGAHLYLPQIRKWLTSNNSEIRKFGLFALQGSKEGILEVLEEVTGTLDDQDFNVACMACRVLVKLGPDGIDAIPELLELHKNGIPSSRSWAAVALGAIGPNTEFDTAQFLAGTLDAFIYQEKQRSLEGLALMGPEAKSSVDEIRAVMRDVQRRVMPEAAYALWRITGETEEPIKVLLENLQNPDIADQVMILAGKMGAAAKPLVPQIVKSMTSEDEGIQEVGLIALGNIGPAAAEAIPTLRSIAEDPDHDALIRFYAKEAIEKIESKDQMPVRLTD